MGTLKIATTLLYRYKSNGWGLQREAAHGPPYTIIPALMSLSHPQDSTGKFLTLALVT